MLGVMPQPAPPPTYLHSVGAAGEGGATGPAAQRAQGLQEAALPAQPLIDSGNLQQLLPHVVVNGQVAEQEVRQLQWVPFELTRLDTLRMPVFRLFCWSALVACLYCSAATLLGSSQPPSAPGELSSGTASWHAWRAATGRSSRRASARATPCRPGPLEAPPAEAAPAAP